MKPNAIDVSLWNTVKSWEKVKNSGIKYVVIKATQGRLLSGDGSPFVDKNFTAFADGCKEAKIPFGFYHFFCAKDVAQAKEEAKYFLSKIKPYKQYCPYVFLDCENYSNKNLLAQNKAQLTESCKAFLDKCKYAGYKPVLYCNPDHLNNYLYADSIGYPLWVAQYGENKPNYKNIMMWQFGEVSVDGASGTIDGNVCYLSDAEFSVMSLAIKGFITSPTYWIDMLPKINYLDQLLLKVDKAYSSKWKQSIFTEYALSKLVKDNVINSPDYWKEQCKKNKNLKQLILNFGGGVI